MKAVYKMIRRSRFICFYHLEHLFIWSSSKSYKNKKLYGKSETFVVLKNMSYDEFLKRVY